jgi:hypothetical protein
VGNAAGEKMKKTSYYKLFCLLLFLIVITQPLLVAYKGRQTFFSRGYMSQYASLKRAYENSQYLQKKNPGIIPDETFESFVGGAFVQGVNPINIVHEHPPLGRYIIGLSILLFDNAATLILPLLVLSLIVYFLISKIILKDSLLALVPVAIFSNEPLFIGKLQYAPLLEAIQLPFILLSLFFFIKGIKSKKSFNWFALASLMVGFVISIRFFVLGATLFCAMLLYFMIKRKFNKEFIYFIISTPLSLVALFLSYTKTVMDGYSLWQILGIQKYLLYYHQTKLENSLTFWDLILFDRWHTWWGNRGVVGDSTWIIAWPISMFSSVISIVSALLKKLKMIDEEIFLATWVVVYCGLLSVGNSTTRYFLPLVPILYILTISFLKRVYLKIFNKK